MADLTRYQQSIVRNYYANLDTALLQRVGEQVTDLYLSEGKKRQKLWTTIGTALVKLGVPQSRVDHIVSTDDPRLLAKLLEELLAREPGAAPAGRPAPGRTPAAAPAPAAPAPRARRDARRA
ncbi:MAG: hypothetical protein ACKOCW_15105 [Planctomycetaceae bacterium]